MNYDTMLYSNMFNPQAVQAYNKAVERMGYNSPAVVFFEHFVF